MNRTLRYFLPFLLLPVLAVGCGSSGDGDGDSDDGFDRDRVRVTIENEDAGSLKLFFVGEGDEEELTAQSVACVESFQDEADMVQCWSFANEELYDNAQVDDETGKMVKMCWATYAATPPGGEGDIKTDKLRQKFRDQYQCETAPSATTFTGTTADEADADAATTEDDDAEEASTDEDADADDEG